MYRGGETDHRYAVYDKVNTDGESDEPDAGNWYLHKQDDPQHSRDDAGEDRPAPAGELRHSGGDCSEQSAHNEERGKHQGQALGSDKRIANEQVSRESAE